MKYAHVWLMAAAAIFNAGASRAEFDPLRLHPLSRDAALAARADYDVMLSKLAYFYAVPPFLHLRQRHQFLSTFTRHYPQLGNPYGQFLHIRAPASGQTTDTMPNKALVELPDPQAVLAVNPNDLGSALDMFQMVNDYLARNPPPDTDRAYLAQFASLGIGPRLTVTKDPGKREAIRKGVALAQTTLSALVDTAMQTRNGWQVPPVHLGVRSRESDIALHAMVQTRSIGYGAAVEATYLQAYVDEAGEPLHARQPYTLTFRKDELPPVNPATHGFWSVTLYDREKFRFFDNPHQKFNVRSADPLVYNADGSLTIYIQQDKPEDPALYANWLPAPPAGDEVIMLRVFQGGPSVTEGRYSPPPIRVARPARKAE